MEYRANVIQRGHISRKLKKQFKMQKVILLLILLLVAFFILIPIQKILHSSRISDLEKRCAIVLEKKQARISELEVMLEDAE